MTIDDSHVERDVSLHANRYGWHGCETIGGLSGVVLEIKVTIGGLSER